jgi:2-polyprenyl-3-methyl-5-hydroxy-6-metoxy-1,4-benzoquinol methylase
MNGTVPCRVCGQDDSARFKIYYDGELKLFRCLECDFVGQYPGPGDSHVIESYEGYRVHLRDGERWEYPERQGQLEDVADRIVAAGGRGRLLDVGCGDGLFISVCQAKGFDAEGNEDAVAYAEYAREQTGAQVTVGRYAPEMYEPESFDVISMIQVVEHVPVPREILEVAHGHLRPGGLVVVEVPSRTAPHFLLYRATRMKRFVDDGKGVLAEHVGYHHPGSIRRIASDAGFQEVDLTTGRWAPKYEGWKRSVGRMIDPVLDRAGVGGILYVGRKPA